MRERRARVSQQRGELMQEMTWLESHVAGGSLEGGLERVNDLYWNIIVEPYDEFWRVRAGEDVIFWADSREAVDAFLYGMSLAYAVLPNEIFDQLRQQVRALGE
jgi:hypothetical protein